MRAGWYGREGQRRQRWWCYPKTGMKHRFTETLPRIVAQSVEGHACPECQTTLEPWEGLPAPRLYGFSAKDVAWALSQVAAGATYRSTADEVRKRAGRALDTTPRKTKSGKLRAAPNAHAQVVSDWVEVFAPVIWDAYAPKRWPKEVLLDDDPLHYSSATGKTLAFYVFGVMGYEGPNRPYVVAIGAFPRATKVAWKRFLATLPGQPEWAVTDGGVTKDAALLQWPDVETWRCEWHLRKNLTDPMPPAFKTNGSDPLHGLLGRAQLSEKHWEEYRSGMDRRRREDSEYTAAWNASWRLDRIIRPQVRGRPDDLPLSTGPLESFFNATDRVIGDRAAMMTNKTRADALLKLIAARRNRWGSEEEWGTLIREYLQTRKGLAPLQRRHTDPRAKPSLRR